MRSTRMAARLACVSASILARSFLPLDQKLEVFLGEFSLGELLGPGLQIGLHGVEDGHAITGRLLDEILYLFLGDLYGASLEFLKKLLKSNMGAPVLEAVNP